MINAKVGDTVTRVLAGIVPMKLKVTEIDEDNGTISCGDWLFDRETGDEIDDDLGWGPQYGHTGSYIQSVGS